MSEELQKTNNNQQNPEEGGIAPELLNFLQGNIQEFYEPTIEDYIGEELAKEPPPEEETPPLVQEPQETKPPISDKYAKYEKLLEALEQDPYFAKKFLDLYYEHYWGKSGQNTPTPKEKSYETEEEEFSQFEYEQKPSEKIVEKIKSEVAQEVYRIINEYFTALRILGEFQRKYNLEYDDMQEILKISQEKGVSLEDAYRDWYGKLEKIRSKIIKELGLEGSQQKLNTMVGSASGKTPVKSEAKEEGVSRGILKKGYQNLSEEEKRQILEKYAPYLIFGKF